MKKKLETKKYEIVIKTDALENDLSWIICQHCHKPVYGMRRMKDAFLPTEPMVKKWEWKGPKWKKEESKEPT